MHDRKFNRVPSGKNIFRVSNFAKVQFLQSSKFAKKLFMFHLETFSPTTLCAVLAGTVCIPSVLFHVNVVIDRQAINVRALVIDT